MHAISHRFPCILLRRFGRKVQPTDKVGSTEARTLDNVVFSELPNLSSAKIIQNFLETLKEELSEYLPRLKKMYIAH